MVILVFQLHHWYVLNNILNVAINTKRTIVKENGLFNENQTMLQKLKIKPLKDKPHQVALFSTSGKYILRLKNTK